MKRFILLFSAFICFYSCSDLDAVKVNEPIVISSPTPTEPIAKVLLNATQSSYVSAGNDMAFRLLGELFDDENLICSPLSLQYAMAMLANGAEGETLEEILDFLRYGDDGIDALNEYCRTLLEQLPAVDLDITLKVTDALLVNDRYELLPAFKKTVEDNYYAAVDNMDFSDSRQIAARINDWARRSTNGFIDKVLNPSDISVDAPAYIMNALYFKAKWADNGFGPMFIEEDTASESFLRSNGKSIKVDMMNNIGFHEYAEMDGFKVLVLPYADGKFNMYVLLPDENDIEGLIGTLQTTAWSDVLGSLMQGARVHVKLPKFEGENRIDLNDALDNLGVECAFSPSKAAFCGMFKDEETNFSVSRIFQKSHISVSEWGTEAGSVTVEWLLGDAGVKPVDEVYFYADHPFAFVIGEETSGTILFEGVVMEP